MSRNDLISRREPQCVVSKCGPAQVPCEYLPANLGEPQATEETPASEASFLTLLCGLVVLLHDASALPCPLAFQICNMLNAPADEYFTFQVMLPSARPRLSALPPGPILRVCLVLR